MIIRKAQPADTEELIRLRLAYLAEDMGMSLTEAEEAVRSHLEDYFPAHLKDGSLLAWIAEEDGRPIGTALLILSERPANPHFPNGKTGTVMNVYTEPDFRRRGIGAQIMTALLEEARELGITQVSLSATKVGEPLYYKLGFEPSDYTTMTKLL